MIYYIRKRAAISGGSTFKCVNSPQLVAFDVHPFIAIIIDLSESLIIGNRRVRVRTIELTGA